MIPSSIKFLKEQPLVHLTYLIEPLLCKHWKMFVHITIGSNVQAAYSIKDDGCWWKLFGIKLYTLSSMQLSTIHTHTMQPSTGKIVCENSQWLFIT